MKKIIYLLFAFIATNQMVAQKIRFEYDEAGNQILRTWCSSCLAKESNQEIKDFSELEESDLQKFVPNDLISFYPNPVINQLYLKWEIINENSVDFIEIYSLEGKMLKNYKDFDKKNDEIISFQEFSKGIYFINLNYSNGDIKSIKIIKE